MREDQLIQKVTAAFGKLRSATQSSPLGMGDDAALWKPKPGYEAIFTCDWFLEGSHFLRHKHPADSVGWKSLARATSDIAAMGGTPVLFLMSLALPPSLTGAWFDDFLLGLRRASKRFNCPLVGGDTTRRDQVLISITVVGQVRRRGAVLRSGARPGDILLVSGRLGEAEAGLWLVRHSGRMAAPTEPSLKKHLYPEPRLALGRWLAEGRLASAMMDLSDGLSADLPRLCAASSVGARVDEARLPVAQLSKHSRPKKLHAAELALHGGDDYELLFTVPRRKLKLIPSRFDGLPVTAIGEVTRGDSILLRTADGSERPLANRGWDPFRNGD